MNRSTGTLDSFRNLFFFRSRMIYDPVTAMIALHFSRTELELLVNAVEIAGMTGWPTGDDRVRVSVLRSQLENAIVQVKSQGWQGGS